MVGSYQFDIPVGASVVVVNLLVFLLFCVVQAVREYLGKQRAAAQLKK